MVENVAFEVADTNPGCPTPINLFRGFSKKDRAPV
jgi:hypothetical protein